MTNFQNQNQSLLFPGTVKAIQDGIEVHEPWFQLIFVKVVDRDPNSGASTSGQRLKVALSDGVNFMQGIKIINLLIFPSLPSLFLL